jgi:hypothetical protein
MSEPRAKTTEEARAEFLNTIRALASYWGETAKTPAEAANGTAFSILALLDGCNASMPAFDVLICPHPDDRAFHIANGENYFDDETSITDGGPLHEEFHQ